MKNINKKQTTFINRCVEDPYTPSPRCICTRLSPSRERGNKLSPSPVGEKVREAGMRGKGFTLIELLVVVLIIGILAAVALQQYQKAVLKSRLASLKQTVQTLAAAQEIYYLNHGTYAAQWKDLDIKLTGTLTISDDSHAQYEWGYCQVTAEYVACRNNQYKIGYAQFMKYATAYARGKAFCIALNGGNSLQTEICKQETGKTSPYSTIDGSWMY